MLLVFIWYLALQLFAFAAWPLTFSICHRLPDRGYGLSKGLGLLLITFITWLLAHLAVAVPMLGFSFETVSAAWFAVVAISVACLARNWHDMARFLRRRARYAIVLELIFIVAFALMLSLRAAVPHISYHITNPLPGSVIDHAAEKFMDFAMLNGLLTSSAFPPHDAWLSGMTLNYYYFGHMLWAVLIKFCSIRPEIGFNLALGSAFAISAALAFALGYNLTRRLRWGFLTLFLIILCSNLDGFLQLVTSLKIAFIDAGSENIWYFGDRSWWRNYDFWRSSRAIENTINEFPAFSFILGDLHAHLSALMISLCGWNVAVQIFRSVREHKSLWTYELHSFDELFLAALICGALSATNSWDVPMFAGVLALALWSGSTGRRDPYAYQPFSIRTALRFLRATEALMLAAITTAVGVVILFFPFLRNFSPPAPALEPHKVTIDGIVKTYWQPGSLLKTLSPLHRSDPFEFIAHWLLLSIFPVALFVIIARRRKASAPAATPPLKRERMRCIALILVACAVAAALMPLWQGWISIILALAIVMIGTLLVSRHLPPLSRWALGLLLMFCVMTWFCEIFYVDDIYSGEIERINTVFKVYYGLWPLMAVATVLSLRLLTGFVRNRRYLYAMIAALLIMGSPYMVLGTINRITSSTRLGHWDEPEDSPRSEPPAALLRPEARADNLTEALDGLRYLSFVHPDDYAALMWARANLPPDAVLLEAVGNQYTYAGRFGTITGRPSFAGWLGHSWGWRGSAFSDANSSHNERIRRLETAAKMFNEPGTSTTLMLLRNENIDYVIIGNQEREQYPAMDPTKFPFIGENVFSHGSTSIYKINYGRSSKKNE